MPDEDIRDEAAAVLRRCFGRRTPAPEAILQSRWSTDEFFAGEATHRTCSQTVHGALLSGLREARRVLMMR